MATDKDEVTVTEPKLRILMPSDGDMELVNQDGGKIVLDPIFYSKESMGPHFHVVEGHMDGDEFVVENTISRYRIKLKADGKLELKKAE